MNQLPIFTAKAIVVSLCVYTIIAVLNPTYTMRKKSDGETESRFELCSQHDKRFYIRTGERLDDRRHTWIRS